MRKYSRTSRVVRVKMLKRWTRNVKGDSMQGLNPIHGTYLPFFKNNVSSTMPWEISIKQLIWDRWQVKALYSKFNEMIPKNFKSWSRGLFFLLSSILMSRNVSHEKMTPLCPGCDGWVVKALNSKTSEKFHHRLESCSQRCTYFLQY